MNPGTRTVLSVFAVDPRRIGGTESFARELSLQLAAHGCRSVLCFLKDPDGAVREYLQSPNVSFETFERSWETGWRPTLRLAGLLRKHRPSIVHFHFTSLLGPFPWMTFLCGHSSIFFTDQASRPAGYRPTRARFLKRVAARVISAPLKRVIAVSEYNRRCLEASELLPPGKTSVVYNGVDLDRERLDDPRGRHFRARWGVPEDATLVVQVSWLIPEKGISDLLGAVRLLRQSGLRVHLMVVGDGPCRRQFEEEAAAMGIDKFVTWTGMVVDPFGEGVFSAADICCQVSRWQEAFGWVIAEAMASGKSMVATRVGGIPELLSHGRTGYLVPPSDPGAIAEAIRVLATDEECRRRIGHAARGEAVRRFDVREAAARVLAFYGVGECADSPHHSGSDLEDAAGPVPEGAQSGAAATSRRPCPDREC